MAIEIIEELDEMPAYKRRGNSGRPDELGPFVVENLLPKGYEVLTHEDFSNLPEAARKARLKKYATPGPILKLQAPASTSTNMRKRFGLDTRLEFDYDNPQKDENGNTKRNKKNEVVPTVYVTARFPGEEKAQEVLAEFAKREHRQASAEVNKVTSSGKR